MRGYSLENWLRSLLVGYAGPMRRDSHRRRHPDLHNAKLCPQATTTAVSMRTERSLPDRGCGSLSGRSSAGPAGSSSVRTFDWPSPRSLIAAPNQGSVGSPNSKGSGSCGVGSAAGVPAGYGKGRVYCRAG
jgi:hypothetical protein